MEYLERYQSNDIIYEMPPRDWWQGWLCGNGSGGATVWNPEDGLQIQLGHTDLLDRAPDMGKDNYGIPNTRHNLRCGLQLHGVPFFDPFYMDHYTARTGLADGITRVEGKNAFGSFEAEFFYSKTPDAFVLLYRDTCREPIRRSFHLEKRGSRFFSRIWTGTEPDTSMGMGHTELVSDGPVIRLTHEKEGFCMADTLFAEANVPYEEYQTEYSLERVYEATEDFCLELRVFPGVDRPLEDCIRYADENFAMAEPMDFAGLLENQRQQYGAQLPDTGIVLPEDPYYENLWYAARYHMRSCYQGKYPAFFINGPFGGNRDKREWADCWLHWNMHDETLGVIKNGDFDLFRAFAEYKMRQIPSGKQLARELYGCGGMVTQDQQKPDGGSRNRSEDYFKLQVYPCLQTSLIFYQYWAFTGDRAFLREKLLPYLTLTLEFWKDYLVEEGGTLHVPRSHPYEFHNGYAFRDCLTELSLLKACLPLLAEVEAAAGVKKTELADWALRAHLAEFTELPVLKDFVTSQVDGKTVYDNPFFYGEPYDEKDRLLALGKSERTGTYVTHCQTHAERMEPDIAKLGGCGAFCSSESAFVYPALLTGSDDSPRWREKMHRPDTGLWEAGRNALRTIRRPAKDEKPSSYPVDFPRTLSWTGHSLELPAFAKLGLADQLEKAMEFYTKNYQMFPQGMFNYHPRNRWLLDSQKYVAADGRKIRFPYFPLCMHFSLEEFGVFTETVDLMLLDSAGGLIRTFPAYRKDASFRLPAEGGFLVEAVQKDGQTAYVDILSRQTRSCSLRTDWERCFLTVDGRREELPIRNAVVSFAAEAGKEYFLTDRPDTERPVLTGHQPGPMENGPVTLGMFPCF